MAKPLVLKFNGADIPFEMTRVERSDLYGYVEIEAVDERGRNCTLATLADDGRNVIISGGIALANFTVDGNWVEKKALVPTDNQGNRITPVPSSYAAPVPLQTKVSIDEYLSHNIRSIYRVASDVDFGPLLEELKQGTIFQFPYSFRGGLESDAAFLLLSADGTPFVAIGGATRLEFVGFDETAAIASDEDGGDGEEDEIDFSMM